MERRETCQKERRIVVSKPNGRNMVGSAISLHRFLQEMVEGKKPNERPPQYSIWDREKR